MSQTEGVLNSGTSGCGYWRRFKDMSQRQVMSPTRARSNGMMGRAYDRARGCGTLLKNVCGSEVRQPCLNTGQTPGRGQLERRPPKKKAQCILSARRCQDGRVWEPVPSSLHRRRP